MPHLDKVDLLAGLLIGVIGGYFLYGAFDYEIGTLTRMGPGFLPMVLGGVAIGLGLLIIVQAIGYPATLPRPAWRPLLAVLAGIGAFAYVLTIAGLVPAVLATVLITSLAEQQLRPLRSLLLAVVVAFLMWLVFIVTIGLPIRAFRIPF